MSARPVPQVVAVTLNPAVDLTVAVDRLTVGAVQRAASAVSNCGGKGVNVAGCLADWGVRVALTGVLGQANEGAFNAFFTEKGITDLAVRAPGATRTNIKIADLATGETTDINLPGLIVSLEAFEAVRTELWDLVAPGRVVALSGSLPDSLPETVWATLAADLASLGARAVLDTSGAALDAALRSGQPLHAVKPNRAELEALVELRRNHGAPGTVECVLNVAGQERRLAIPVGGSGGRHVERFTVTQPKLWWPHNHGGQPLYEWSAALRRQGRDLDRRTGRFGIRTIALIQEPTGDGGISFIVAVNGRPIFLKGKNWTPADAMFCRVTDARYRELVSAAKGANINAMRVWGGGVYERDSFYDLCDELGILLTHDFMFACGCYPQDLAFLDEAQREAVHQVRRLRNHPSMAAWFGDNENDVLADNSFNYPNYRFNRLSKEVLASVVREHAPLTPYVPTSPYSPLTYDQNSPLEGDCHIWGHGWSYKSDFYVKQRPRMVTEIGHLGMPPMEVVEAFTSPENRWPIWNPEFLTHGADCARLDMEGRFRTFWDSIKARGWEEPSSLEDLIAKTQKLQAEATKFWVEFYGNQPECWGIFLWNLADSWPQMSDAYIAYPFHPKPAFAAVKEAYGALKR